MGFQIRNQDQPLVRGGDRFHPRTNLVTGLTYLISIYSVLLSGDCFFPPVFDLGMFLSTIS